MSTINHSSYLNSIDAQNIKYWNFIFLNLKEKSKIIFSNYKKIYEELVHDYENWPDKKYFYEFIISIINSPSLYEKFSNIEWVDDLELELLIEDVINILETKQNYIDALSKIQNTVVWNVEILLLPYLEKVYDEFSLWYNVMEWLEKSPWDDIDKIKFLCEFLVYKINESKSWKDVEKIPLIISNISLYRWWQDFLRKYSKRIDDFKTNVLTKLYVKYNRSTKKLNKK